MNLLLIDPDPAWSRHLGAHLAADAAGWRLVYAPTVGEGLDVLRTSQVAAIALAAAAGAPEAMEWCRQLTMTAPGVPLLIVADEATDDGWLEQFSHAAADVLVRPRCSAEQFLERVRIAVRRSRQRATHPAQAVLRGASRLAERAGGAPRMLVGESVSSKVAAAGEPGAETPPADSARGLRVLQVDGDDIHARLLQSSLAATMKVRCNVERVSKLADALQCLVERAFDVIVVEPSLPDSDGPGTLASLRPFAEESPIVVVTKEDDRAQALESLSLGAEDCHFKSDLDASHLARSIRMAVARHQHRLSDFDQQRARQSVQKARHAVQAPPDERRAQPRYLLTRPVVAIPILADGQPLETFRMEGLTLDLSVRGVRLEIPGIARLPSQRMLIGIESAQGDLHFATLETCWARPIPGGLGVGGRFLAVQDEMVRPENLLPHLNPLTHRFETRLSCDVLEAWCRAGIARTFLMDRVLGCPDCRALLTVRHGCRACGSVRISSSRLIHHFPCAHVDLVEQFEASDELVCPKCRQRRLIVGADFEYLQGPYQCQDCSWSDNELELVGQCLACELRFPLEQAEEEELVGYHVERLDPLALLEEHG